MGYRTSWKKTQAKVTARHWDERIIEQWLDFVPVHWPTATPPSLRLSEHVDLCHRLSTVDREAAEVYISDEIEGVREVLLAESIFWYHKALHVLHATSHRVASGLVSWPISESYHSAFFSLHSLLGFLGVSFLEVSGVNFIVDVWPTPRRKAKKRNRVSIGSETIAVVPCMPPLHRHRWGVLQRVLNTGKVQGWSVDSISFISSLAIEDFSNHRNRIHYRSNFWPADDLYETIVPKFPIPKDEVRPESHLFSLNVAVLLSELCLVLLSDLSRVARQLRDDAVLATQRVGEIRLLLNEGQLRTPMKLEERS